MMRWIVFIIIVSASVLRGYSQIPYFATAPGMNKLYGYTSLKFRPGLNAQETYTTFQYGVGKGLAFGLDLATSVASSEAGVLVRYGLPLSRWFMIGFQFTPSFDMKDNMKFTHLTSAMYLNGDITRDSKLFWTSNTWYSLNKGTEFSLSQYLYLGYTVNLPHNQKLTPMSGVIYSWKFNSDVDWTAGAYWSVSRFNVYVWGNDLLKKYPRIIVGIDFLF